jgi:hypothetical protein
VKAFVRGELSDPGERGQTAEQDKRQHPAKFRRVSGTESLHIEGKSVAKTKAQLSREWREQNPDKVREYNKRRCVTPTKSACVECGTAITGRKDRLLCDQRRCKDQRYQRTHPDE